MAECETTADSSESADGRSRFCWRLYRRTTGNGSLLESDDDAPIIKLINASAGRGD